MPKQREPIDLLVAKGRKHFTKRDIEERRASEIKVPFTDIECPTHLKGKQRAEFYDIAYKLVTIGVMTELDEEALARYIIAKKLYIDYSRAISLAMKEEDFAAAETLLKTQDKLFKQARQAASDLGLTITSRCKLYIPPNPNENVEL